MRVLCCSVTERGAALARRLPFEHRHGALVATVREGWGRYDAFVLICATGVAVRAAAPMLVDKATDPAVVCLDDTARWAVALTGGHAGGANRLARELAALTGAEAVVTTASDEAGLPALDALEGVKAEGDVTGVMRRWLDGQAPRLLTDPELAAWPLPPALARLAGPDRWSGSDEGLEPPRVRLTDRDSEAEEGEVLLHPPSLVIGVGTSRGASVPGLRQLVENVLRGAGLHPAAVGRVVTHELKVSEPAITELARGFGVPLGVFPAAELAAVAVPNPNPVVQAAVGTPSVAEAAALLGAGPGGELVVAKQKSADSTVAVARRHLPVGALAVVGLGPGDAAWRTQAAAAAVRSAAVVIGYGPYVDLAADLLSSSQEVLRYPIGEEAERCAEALRRAAGGQRVALVCSGDPGVYAMAGLVLEMAPQFGDPPVRIEPGVTAALSAAGVLGAPLGHDHAAISLSDLLTPWPVIRRRLEAARDGDFVVSLYNPRSRRRTTQLVEAMTILSGQRLPDTPVAVVTNAGRPTQKVVRTTLAALDPGVVDMVSMVIVGSSTTRWIGTRMVTPRGYNP
ncbi:MAG: precorrin-3B C(17)-methyltransferase [Acidimicrobiales bacterium]